jgi:hypothetical protein
MNIDAVLNVSYCQIMSLIQQLPTRSQLRLGCEFTKSSTKKELTHFLDTFKTAQLSEDTILYEVKQVRKERYAHRKKG